MEDDLIFLSKMDDLNFQQNGRRHIFLNGRRPQIVNNMEDYLKLLTKWKMTSIMGQHGSFS
jgi:hypothetical protein